MVFDVYLPTLLLIVPSNVFVSIIINITNGPLYPSIIFNFLFSNMLITDEACSSVIPSIKLLLTNFMDFSVGFLHVSSSELIGLLPLTFSYTPALINRGYHYFGSTHSFEWGLEAKPRHFWHFGSFGTRSSRRRGDSRFSRIARRRQPSISGNTNSCVFSSWPLSMMFSLPFLLCVFLYPL